MNTGTITITNCEHLDSGWCLECVAELCREKEKLEEELERIDHEANVIRDA